MEKNLSVAVLLNAPEMKTKIAEDSVICADGGYRYAANKKVIAVVGDFDSLGEIPNGENIIKLEKEKNFTDGEQAVRTAVNLGYKKIVIYGAFGGRTEHILGNLALLKMSNELRIDAEIRENNLTVRLETGKTYISGKIGESLSIIPFGGECLVKTSVGLYYPLENLLLKTGETRGISNVITNGEVVIEIVKGEALIFHYEKE